MQGDNNKSALIESVNLLLHHTIVKQLVRDAFLSGDQHAIVGENAEAGARLADCLHRVLNLMQSTCNESFFSHC